MQIQPREIPKYQINNIAKLLLKAVLKQFEDPKTAEEFNQWLKERESKEKQTAEE